jgi:hypothetical protein
MNRYRSYGAQDDQPQVAGDQAFLGVNEYDTPQNLQPGEVQKAVNVDFRNQAAETRGGFVCYPELGADPFGAVWTERVSGTTTDFNAVAYGNGFFLAAGFGEVIKSTDGINWATSATPSNISIASIGFGNGVFIATGLGVASNACILRSTDGITWTAVATAPADNRNYSVVQYGDGTWVSFSTSGFLVYSTDDGLTWSTATAVSGTTNATGLAYGNGVFILAVVLGRVYKSYDGITWTRITTAPSELFTDCGFGNQIFVLLGSSGVVYTSLDLDTWTKTRDADNPTAFWTSILFDSGRFLAVSEERPTSPARVMSSISGTGWTFSPSIPQEDWQDIICGGDICVAVGLNGKIMTSKNATTSIFASGIYSDPNNIGETWIMLVGYNKVGFFANGRTGKTISLGSYTVNEQSTIVQANNYVYIFRGDSETPLYWDGNWNGTFAEVPATTLPDSFESIPDSNQATYYQNRLWIRKGKDGIAASDVLSFTDYDPLANEFNLNTGNSDYVVATYPFGQNSLVAFKNKSVLLLQNVEGSLSDVTVTEVTRQVGVVGINSVTSIGPDLAYVSNRNINLLTLTSTNNSLQHKTLPLSTKIRKIIDRVNWDVGYKISLGYWNNRLYVALPLDNSVVCNAVVVYNFITDRWYGEWNFSDTLNMCIQGWQVVDYLGLQRMHAITEDGRIFVTDEGQNDISGTTLAEISTELVTRAYMTQNLNHFQRRMFMDIATNRPDLSVSVYTDGASEESVLLTDQTYSRSESWLFNDDAYDLTNVNDDYNRAYRKDYSTGPSSVQPGTGFQPEMLQEQRLPLISRRQGRLSWIKLTNTQGLLTARTLGYETRPGQRANLTQV